MKCLTLWQPWASLIADGRKTIETRSWSTKYRGLLGIHAGDRVDKEACIEFGYDPKTIVYGAIICTAILDDCLMFPQPFINPDPYGDFTIGRYGWILKDVKVLKEPIHVKGNRMIWNYNAPG